MILKFIKTNLINWKELPFFYFYFKGKKGISSYLDSSKIIKEYYINLIYLIFLKINIYTINKTRIINSTTHYNIPYFQA